MAIHIKTVRNDYSSLFARVNEVEGGRVYEIGTTHEFPGNPAIVGEPLADYCNLYDAWVCRPEPGSATQNTQRLLLVDCEARKGSFRGYCWWSDIEYARNDADHIWGLLTHKLTVIGEIFVPDSWRNHR